ncbi:MAG: zf-TFIIB domain-containing protein [Planctomycetes bacterium]|nr:zf-TFIIB domain-containing protein [Planctomycetota bacterium]
MDTCPDCGNHDMRVRLLDGSPVFRCELCGGEFGDRAASESLRDTLEAQHHGFDPLVWPLVRALNQLPGLVVGEASAGDEERAVLPSVEIAVRNEDCLLQLENLAKALLLGAAAMSCHWVVEVEYRRHLAFVLKPRFPGEVTARTVRDAQGDLERLRRQLERDQKLGWWQHPPEAMNG